MCLFTFPLAICSIYIADKLGAMIGSGLSGWTSGQINSRERFSAGLEKIKYSIKLIPEGEALHRWASDYLREMNKPERDNKAAND